MGGNALKEFGVERLSKAEFYSFQLWMDFGLREAGFYDDRDFHFIKAYEDKDSFGDLDVLINKTNGSGTKLLEWFIKGRVCRKNGDCYSVLYWCGDKKFQVDFICEKDKDFDFAGHYFDYNDLGNLIGRVAHKMGYKFGHNGLWYVLRDGDYKVGDICITKDFYEAIKFLGFDADRYKQGFKSLEYIFEFIVANPFFDPASYDLNNRSRYARIRDVKRPTYQKFLKWIEGREFPTCKSAKFNHLRFGLDYFPKFKQEHRELQLRHKKKKAVAEKWNGYVVMDLTPLEGKELGKFMSDFKKQFNSKQFTNFDEYVLSAPKEEIEETIVRYYAKQYKV